MSIGELLNQRLSHQELLDSVLDVLISTTNADAGSILLMDYEKDRLEFSAANGPAAEALRNYHLNEGEGIAGHVAKTGETLLLPDPAKDPRFLGELAERLGYPVSSLICVPLIKSDCVVGAIEILNNRKGAFEEKHLQLLEAATPQVLLVLENHRLRSDMQKRLDELQALVQVGKVVNSSMNLEEVLGIALDRARWIMRAEAASIFLLDEEKEELRVVSARGGASEEIQHFRLPAGRGIAGAVVSEGKTLLVADVNRDERFFGGFDEQTKFQTRSILCAPLRAKGKVFGALEVINRIDKSGFSEGDRPLLEAFAEQSAVAIHNAKLNDEMEEMFINSIAAFAEAVDARDSYTAGHSTRVAHYADCLTKLLEIDEAQREQIHVAALLHDVGKIGVPDAILNKPGRLSFEEFSLMKLHPQIGYEILQPIEQFRSVILGIIRHHHERWDGGGYPSGFTGDEIPFGARVLAVADTFDAMVTNRPYRDAMNVEAALSEIEEGIGAQFDPDLARFFLDGIRSGLIKRPVEKE